MHLATRLAVVKQDSHRFGEKNCVRNIVNSCEISVAGHILQIGDHEIKTLYFTTKFFNFSCIWMHPVPQKFATGTVYLYETGTVYITAVNLIWTV